MEVRSQNNNHLLKMAISQDNLRNEEEEGGNKKFNLKEKWKW